MRLLVLLSALAATICSVEAQSQECLVCTLAAGALVDNFEDESFSCETNIEKSVEAFKACERSSCPTSEDFEGLRKAVDAAAEKITSKCPDAADEFKDVFGKAKPPAWHNALYTLAGLVALFVVYQVYSNLGLSPAMATDSRQAGATVQIIKASKIANPKTPTAMPVLLDEKESPL
jgi:hypothetical protein